MKTMANKLCVACLWMLLVCVMTAWPQASSSLAELRGTVTDTNGAAIPNANITLTDADRGTARNATTNENGEYTFLGLQPSSYDLRVEAAGKNFAASTTRITLTIGQQANIPVQLSAGGVSVGIDVVAGSEVVETGRTQQSSVINERELIDLPVSRRDFLNLALLTPGVNDSSNINDTTDARVAQGRSSGLSFGGNNGRGNLVTVDGGPVITATGGVFETVSQEAVQEFQVLRNSYSAEFGPSQGGIVNTVTKSGSNRISGSVFGLFRTKQLDSRNSFDFNPGGKSPFSRQQFGGSFGAPIQKDKTFFFTAYERFNQKQSTFVSIPLTGPSTALTTAQAAFLSAIQSAPSTSVNPSFVSNLSALSIANAPRTLQLFNSANGSFPFKTNQTYFSARVDHTFSDRASAFVRIHANDFYGENQAAGALTAVSRGRLEKDFNTGILASYTQQLGANTVNELKADFLYASNRLTPNDANGPQFNIQGYGFFGRDIFLPSYATIRDYDFIDNVTTVSGSHTVKIGGNLFLINQLDTNETFFGGRFDFQSLPLSTAIALNPRLGIAAVGQIQTYLTQTGNLTALSALGQPISALQTFNLDTPAVYQQGFGTTTVRGLNVRPGVYAQDTWKITKNFTLNYGLRYSQNREPYGIFRDKTNFQPRAGFAYDLQGNGKTVIRGGAGIYASYVNRLVSGVIRTLGNPSQQNDDINIVLTTASAGSLGVPTSIQVYQRLQALTNNFTRTATAADLATLGIVPRANGTLEVRFLGDPKFRTPQSYQFSLAVERDLGAGFSFEASYLHNRGIYISRNRDTNQFKASLLTIDGNKPCFYRFGAVPATCYNPNSATRTTPPASSDFLSPLRFQDNLYDSSGNSFYDAATFVLRRRFTQNVSILAHYTFSKAIDEVTDFNSDFSAQNPLNVRDDRSLSSFDQRHRVIISGVLQAPKFGDSAAGKIFRDFVVSPIFTYGSGRPFNLLAGADLNNDGRSQSDRPFRIGRNTGIGDKQITFDARLSRRFAFGERRYLELIFEGFNLFNRNNFIGINNVVGDLIVRANGTTSTGLTQDQVNQIFATGGRPIKGNLPTQPLGYTQSGNQRQFQFGGRFNF